jgi:hypothetical protein
LDGDVLGHEGSDAAWAAGVKAPVAGSGGSPQDDGALAPSSWHAKQDALR